LAVCFAWGACIDRVGATRAIRAAGTPLSREGAFRTDGARWRIGYLDVIVSCPALVIAIGVIGVRVNRIGWDDFSARCVFNAALP
jgi:hypothetical protein